MVWAWCLWGAAGALAGAALTQVRGSPFATGQSPGAVAFSPSGRLLVTANGTDTPSGSVSVFAVGSGGALTRVPGSPFATGAGPQSVAFSPSGGLLAVANFNASTVSVFAVGSGGALSPVPGSPFATDNPQSVAFSPSGGLLAAPNWSDATVSMFSVGPGGTLTPVPGSPFALGAQSPAAEASSDAVAFSPDGRLLATADGANSVYVFSVGSGGALTPVPGSPFATGGRALTGTWSVAFSPDGRLLATADQGPTTNGVSVFAVGSGGSLTRVPGSPFATGNGTTPDSVAFSPNGALLASADELNEVSLFAVGSGGALTQVPGSPFATGNGTTPDSVAFSPGGGLLAATDYYANEVSVFVVASSTIAPLRVLIASARATVARSTTHVVLACARNALGASCRGKLSLTIRRRVVRRVRHRRKVSFKTVVLASARYALSSGGGKVVGLRLTAAGLMLLEHAPGHRLRVLASATLIGARAATRTIILQLKS